MKPIYEVYIPASIVTEEAHDFIEKKLHEKIGDEYHPIVISDQSVKHIRTRIIYPTATFWGWWYNLWNFNS